MLINAIKQSYRPSWGSEWRKRFTVDIVNGAPGHELKLDGKKLIGAYLRVGLWKNGAWRTYKLRQDFLAADKVQMEDDITASTVVQPSGASDHRSPRQFQRKTSSGGSSRPSARPASSSSIQGKTWCRSARMAGISGRSRQAMIEAQASERTRLLVLR